jgi:serine/threonine-protein kinase
MAEVYLARQKGIAGFEKTVVIKRVLPHLVTDKKFITMFLDEARLASRLHHPNLVEIYDLGENEGEYYIAMEYVPGFSTATIMKRAREDEIALPYALCAHAMMQVCSGLKYAHELADDEGENLGLIHRDVAPDNIMVMPTGSVKLIDFGIAKSALNESHTLTGTIKGKLRHMSPEQLLGRTLDPRSDIFALGIVLYELTTGVHPFGSGEDLDIASRIVTETHADPKSIRANFPEALVPIIDQSLAKNLEERFADAGAFHQALEDFLDGLGTHISDNELGVFISDLFGGEAAEETAVDTPGTETLPDLALSGLDSPTMVQDSPLPPLVDLPPPSRRLGRGRAPLWIALVTIILGVGAVFFFAPKEKEFPVSNPALEGTLKIETTPRMSAQIGDKEVPVSNPALEGTLKVETTPRMIVQIGDTVLGMAPLEVPLQEGEYLLRLSNDDILEELPVTIKRQSTADIIRFYEQVPLSFSVPSGTEIRIGGIVWGKAPLESFMTYPGVRTVILTSPDGEESATRVIQVGIEGSTLTHSWE